MRAFCATFETRASEHTAVVVATGCKYGGLPLDRLATAKAPGSYYDATIRRRAICKGTRSGHHRRGQLGRTAAMFLSQLGPQVRVLVAGRRLPLMSRYIPAGSKPTTDHHELGDEVSALHGD